MGKSPCPPSYDIRAAAVWWSTGEITRSYDPFLQTPLPRCEEHTPVPDPGATALSEQSRLATSDPALATVVRTEGGTVHPLADSDGIKP
jgi:hypothetical protein